MSAIHAIPMNKEELTLVQILVHRHILKQQKFIDEFQEDAVKELEIRIKQEKLNLLHARLADRCIKIWEGK